MNLYMNDPNLDMNKPMDLVVQSNQREWKKNDGANTRKRKPSYCFLWIATLLILINLAGCDSSPDQNQTSQAIYGTVTGVETGKDGVQVELETENGLYSVTISIIQSEIEGGIEKIKMGTQIEVTGEIIDGMEPPLLVAEQVTILKNSEPKVEDSLQGKTWLLTSYNETQPITDRHPTLEFDGDQVSGTTGCNHYGGMYQVDGNSIRFEGIFSTEMACLEQDGLMEQERIYLELLRTADQFDLDESTLTFFAALIPILVFEIQLDEPTSIGPITDPNDSVSVTVAPTSTVTPEYEPPEGWNPYQDPGTGISVYIPGDWIVTGIIEGEYAILQSYPEDKYVGGEMREDGDTKCDLSVRSEGERADDLIEQWNSNSMTTIVSENEFIYQSGVTGQRFVIDSMGRATVFITEINQRVVLLTCFGDFSLVDEIALTLNSGQ
jgi:heat shock protein HslJ